MDDFERADLAAQYAKVSAQIDQLTEVKDMIRTRLLAEGPGSRGAGNLKVIVSENRRLDPKAFAEKFAVEDHYHLYKQVPDTDKVKELSREDQDTVYKTVGSVVKVVSA